MFPCDGGSDRSPPQRPRQPQGRRHAGTSSSFSVKSPERCLQDGQRQALTPLASNQLRGDGDCHSLSPTGHPDRRRRFIPRQERMRRQLSPLAWQERSSQSRMQYDRPTPDDSSAVRVAFVKEYIDEESGIAELEPTEDDYLPTVFFHACVAYDGRGELIFSGCQRHPPSMRQMFPLGSEVRLKAELLPDSFVDHLCLAIWDKSDPTPSAEQTDRPPRELRDHFALFRERSSLDDLVCADVHEMRASVRNISDEDFGILRVEVSRDSTSGLVLFALFHREDIYLPDDEGRAVDHQQYKDKPLKAIVSEGQACFLNARSITYTKGFTIQPAELELQSIVVSLSPFSTSTKSPRATRLTGGPGCLCKYPTISYFYFDQELRQRLNLKLKRYFDLKGKPCRDIDPRCLEIDMWGKELKTPIMSHSRRNYERRVECDIAAQRARTLSKPAQEMPRQLNEVLMRVKELRSPRCGILEDPSDPSRRCLFSTDVALLRPNTRLSDNMPVTSLVKANMTFVSSENDVQYVASLVWEERGYPNAEAIRQGQQMDEELMRLYRELNNRDKLPQSLTLQEGTVFRQLDENYGLIRVGGDLTFCLALFDVCDFWLDPYNTVEKRAKRLGEVVVEGDRVLLHANLADGLEKVQYLASAVWLASTTNAFTEKTRPEPIRRESVPQQKLDIYREVLRQMAFSFPDLKKEMARKKARDQELQEEPRQQQQQLLERRSLTVEKVLLRERGHITTLFVDGDGYEPVVSGLITLDNNGEKVFFLRENYLLRQRPEPGLRLTLNCAVVKSSTPFPDKINMVALSVFGEDVVHETKSMTNVKAEASLRHLVSLAERFRSRPVFLKVSSAAYISLQKVDRHSRKRRSSLHFEEDLSSVQKEQCLTESEVVSFGRLVTLLSPNSGILEDVKMRNFYVYFEADDLNLQGVPYDLDAVAPLLSKTPNLDVKYKANRSGDRHRIIKAVAHDRGVQIVVRRRDWFPPSFSGLHLSKVSDQPLASKEKRIRAWDAEVQLSRNHVYKTVENFQEILERPVKVVNQRGIVKTLVNANFGIINGISGLCLFDYYDVHLNDGGPTAAEAGHTLNDVLSQHDEVAFNAHLISSTGSPIPYLATAVWRPTSLTAPVPILPRESVQNEKIDIYKKVVTVLSQEVKPEDGEKKSRKK